jgi:uncharacterized protein YcnI
MRSRLGLGVIVALAATASLSAHIMVSPTTALVGKTQKYELRVHNESKVDVTGVDLDVPDGITVLDVAQPASGTVSTEKTAGRITRISWQVKVAPSTYVPLTFTAKNPDAPAKLDWTTHEHLADGSTVLWSNKPGAQEKGSVTTIR